MNEISPQNHASVNVCFYEQYIDFTRIRFKSFQFFSKNFIKVQNFVLTTWYIIDKQRGTEQKTTTLQQLKTKSKRQKRRTKL